MFKFPFFFIVFLVVIAVFLFVVFKVPEYVLLFLLIQFGFGENLWPVQFNLNFIRNIFCKVFLF